MNILQYQADIAPATIAIDRQNSLVAFMKNPKTSTFIDSIGDLPIATWKDNVLLFDNVEYEYKKWTALHDKPLLRDYLSLLIQHCEAKQANQFTFKF